MSELKAFIVLVALAGVHNSGREDAGCLWSSNRKSRDIFQCQSTMSWKCFLFLLIALTFDDFYTREDRIVAAISVLKLCRTYWKCQSEFYSWELVYFSWASWWTKSQRSHKCTMRKNKREVAPEFQSNKQGKVITTVFGLYCSSSAYWANRKSCRWPLTILYVMLKFHY